MSVSILVSSFGIRMVPWVGTSELLPMDVRGPGTSLASISANIQSAVAYKIYLFAVKEITLAGTFVAFAVVNLVGFAVLYYKMPETEGISLVELETLFSRDRPKHDTEGQVNGTVELDPLRQK